MSGAAAVVERCGVKCCGDGDSREIYAAPGTEMALDEAAAALCIRADAADRGENGGTRSSPDRSSKVFHHVGGSLCQIACSFSRNQSTNGK